MKMHKEEIEDQPGFGTLQCMFDHMPDSNWCVICHKILSLFSVGKIVYDDVDLCQSGAWEREGGIWYWIKSCVGVAVMWSGLGTVHVIHWGVCWMNGTRRTDRQTHIHTFLIGSQSVNGHREEVNHRASSKRGFRTTRFLPRHSLRLLDGVHIVTEVVQICCLPFQRQFFLQGVGQQNSKERAGPFVVWNRRKRPGSVLYHLIYPVKQKTESKLKLWSISSTTFLSTQYYVIQAKSTDVTKKITLALRK